jgi:hypothetical protein
MFKMNFSKDFLRKLSPLLKDGVFGPEEVI